MAHLLKIPPELVKARFLEGLPNRLYEKVKMFIEEEDQLDRVLKVVERLINCQNDSVVCSSSLVHSNEKRDDDKSDESDKKLEKLVIALTEEVSLLKAQFSGNRGQDSKHSIKCFACGKGGHIARYCRSQLKCTICGLTGHSPKYCSKNVHRPERRPAEF
jgi:hypothetical protein